MKQHESIAILSFLDSPAFGGAEQYLFSHLYFLNKQGYAIVLATNNKNVDNEILSRLTIEDKQNFKIVNAPYRLDAIGNWKGLIKFFLSLPYAFFWCFITLKQLTRKYEKVICLWPGFSDRLVFSPIAWAYHCPLIWIEIGPLEPTFKRNFGFPKLLYRLSERFSTHVITTSLFTKTSIIKNSHFTPKDITLIYPGARIFSQKEIESFRKKAKGLTNLKNAACIGVVARLADENEIGMVIHAFYLYLQKHRKDKCVLLIIGDGPKRFQLEELTQRLKISNRVRFFGFVSEKEKRIILASCKFFIFPRAWELDGFGITTIEAMSLGLPVLTTNFGPQIEILTDGKEGYRYKPHDSVDLSLKIAKMRGLKVTDLKRMRQATIKRAYDFSDIRSNKKMLAIIESQSSL